MGQLQDRVARQRKLRNKRILVGTILIVLFTAVVVGAYCWFVMFWHGDGLFLLWLGIFDE